MAIGRRRMRIGAPQFSCYHQERSTKFTQSNRIIPLIGDLPRAQTARRSRDNYRGARRLRDLECRERFFGAGARRVKAAATDTQCRLAGTVRDKQLAISRLRNGMTALRPQRSFASVDSNARPCPHSGLSVSPTDRLSEIEPPRKHVSHARHDRSAFDPRR